MLLSSLAIYIQEVWFQKRKLKLKEMSTLLRPCVQPAASLQSACSQPAVISLPPVELVY